MAGATPLADGESAVTDFNEMTSPPPAPGGAPSADEKTWGMLAHLSALIGGLLTSWVGGLGVFLGPLIVWLIKKDTMPFVDDQAKEALNFNITLAIIGIVLLIFTVGTFGIGALITVPLYVVVALAWLVLTILAAVKANNGEAYRYPFAIRLIK